MNPYIISIVAGACIGIIYAVLFIAQHKILFSMKTHKRFLVVGMTLTRFALLGLCFYLVLRSPITNRILVLISFTTTFWFTLFWAKIYPHARS